MDALDRMFHLLVQTIRTKHPAYLSAPFTVAELYQQVLPYRHYRRDLALETNQEYELVLMELLAGARGYLDVDERLRDELGKEIHASTPEPSRVRDFADAHVAINADAAASVSDARATGTKASSTPQQRPSGASRGLGSSVSGAPDAPRCRFCGGDLPSGRELNFCPHCGQNLRVLNCPACGAELEDEWKFCVACGKSVA